MIAAKGA